MRPSLLARLRDDQRGSVLFITIAVTGVLSLMVSVAFAVARRSIEVADRGGRTVGALAAAEAGLDDYLFRLNNLDEYWQYDHTNPDPGGNPAFIDPDVPLDQIPDLVPESAWTPLAGDESYGEYGEYVYSVDTSQLAAEGIITVTSTGRVVPPGIAARDVRPRTVTATVKQQSFLDYLYFTDFETLDPVVYGSASDQQWAQDNCSIHRWVAERPSGCIEIYWTGNDTVNGPFHTNDRWRISGNPTWEDEVSGSADDLTFYTGSGSPNFNGGAPFYQRPLTMPPSNSQLRTLANHDAGGEGCLFTGPTEIVLDSSGTVTVDSPYTRETGAHCGGFSGSGDDAPQTISIPPNGVIYVQPIPADPADPNYTSGCPFGDNGLGYPIAYDDNDYSCRDGDVFIEGTLEGRMTVAAANDIVITWHLLYAGSDDMLGLIANEFVQIYHPVHGAWSYYYENLDALPNHNDTFTDPQINAAILSLNHSFMVQEWAEGDDRLGTIHLNGAIAQVYRGPVGTFNSSGTVSGYDKDYQYDARLRYTNPPNFIDPVEASWRILQFTERFE